MSFVRKLAAGALGLLARLRVKRAKPLALPAAKHVDAARYVAKSRPRVRHEPRFIPQRSR